MIFFGLSLLTIFMGGTLIFLPGLSRRMESSTHTVLVLIGCGLGLLPAWQALAGGKLPSVLVSWPVPGGRIELGIDSLSGLFLLLHFIVSAAAVLFGSSYFEPYGTKRSLKPVRFFLSGFIVSIALVLTARNAVLFLAAWEIMALAGFFLVAFEDHELQVRNASLLYLAATHLGTLCLFAAFGLLGMRAGSLAFAQMAGNSAVLAVSTPVFVLALLGFGSKAGFVPLHIWLPEAHPAAPSPVSALMSGVMIKTGIYGLLRVLAFFSQPPAWWGFTLGAIGICSGVFGILWASAQSDFKRLLAYSSIENVGIIALGLGIGYLGVSFRNPLVALFGLAGALWHVVNHGLFKSTLFLGAGSVLHATGSREMDRQGGLFKRMPFTGFFVLMASVAICGLPPFNGFVSEWLIYSGAFHAGQGRELYPLVGAPVLALIGALAVVCFSKAFGTQFLGTARTERASAAKESDLRMIVPMGSMAGICLAMGLMPGWFFPMLGRAAGATAPLSQIDFQTVIGNSGQPLSSIGLLSGAFLLLVVLLSSVHGGVLSGKEVTQSSTWGCGYSGVGLRTQYTASSFTQFPVFLFRSLVGRRAELCKPEGYFPAGARFKSSAPDLVLNRIMRPVTERILTWISTFQRLQHGKVQLYLLYVFVFLVALILWKL
ncbi:MAG: hydrogenase [Candidatus Omnitrophica bacterium]|nr:hydrogenase [Candidatus Omnitrophota bacterium]